MNPEDFIDAEEAKIISETKNEQPTGGAAGRPDITSVLDEEVKVEKIEENLNINPDDFTVDNFSEAKSTPVKEEKKDPEKKEPELPEPVQAEIKKDPAKQAAVARLMKPATIFKFYNIVAGRVGGIANKTNPDCLKFDRQDTEDLTVLLEDTVQEENWSGVPTKWLLLLCVGLIIVGKIVMWKKPPRIEETKENSGQSLPAEFQKSMLEMSQAITRLGEENQKMWAYMEKKLGEAPVHQGTPKMEKIYKGYDLTRISFTEKGALIDPDKAGQKGYTEDGKKMGFISHADKDLRRQWLLYRELNQEEFAV